MLATVYAIPDVLVFVASAALILVGAVGVIAMKNPVHSALSLIMCLLGVALAFLEQSADFLAAAEIIVYAGAIVVLFLFVIMFLGVDKSRHPHVEPLIAQRWLAATGVVVTVAGVIFLMANSHWVSGVPSTSTGGVALATGAGNVSQLGDSVLLRICWPSRPRRVYWSLPWWVRWYWLAESAPSVTLVSWTPTMLRARSRWTLSRSRPKRWTRDDSGVVVSNSGRTVVWLGRVRCADAP